MAAEIFSLDELDAEPGARLFSAGTEQLGFAYKHFRNGLSRGVEQVTLRCGGMIVAILPTRGMGIRQAECMGVRFGWDSPVAGPVHPMWVPLADPGGLGWLEGFDEMMVRCGLTSNGAPEFDSRGHLLFPLHGRIANLPASDVVIELDHDSGVIQISGTVVESRFHFSKLRLETTIRLDRRQTRIEITDRVVNASERPAEIQMLYHNNFGTPILGKGARFLAPLKRLAPRDKVAGGCLKNWNKFSGPDSSCREEVYFLELAADENQRSRAMLVDADQRRGVSVDYDTTTLPCFTLWKNAVGMADGYVSGLEPGTNFPNTKSFESQKGRVVALRGGERVDFSVNIEMHLSNNAVGSALRQINDRSPARPEILDQPNPDWSPAP